MQQLLPNINTLIEDAGLEEAPSSDKLYPAFYLPWKSQLPDPESLNRHTPSLNIFNRSNDKTFSGISIHLNDGAAHEYYLKWEGFDLTQPRTNLHPMRGSVPSSAVPSQGYLSKELLQLLLRSKKLDVHGLRLSQQSTIILITKKHLHIVPRHMKRYRILTRDDYYSIQSIKGKFYMHSNVVLYDASHPNYVIPSRDSHNLDW